MKTKSLTKSLKTMNTAILISFLFPAIVAVMLTKLLINERDYFLQNQTHSRNAKLQRERKNEKSKNDDFNNLDFSDGIMGI